VPLGLIGQALKKVRIGQRRADHFRLVRHGGHPLPLAVEHADDRILRQRHPVEQIGHGLAIQRQAQHRLDRAALIERRLRERELLAAAELADQQVAHHQRLGCQGALEIGAVRHGQPGRSRYAVAHHHAVRRDHADAVDIGKARREANQGVAARRRVALAHRRELTQRHQHGLRAFDHAVELARDQIGHLLHLLADLGAPLLAHLQLVVGFHREHRHGRQQHQEQQPDAELVQAERQQRRALRLQVTRSLRGSQGHEQGTNGCAPRSRVAGARTV
jgi:hypothetical protein